MSDPPICATFEGSNTQPTFFKSPSNIAGHYKSDSILKRRETFSRADSYKRLDLNNHTNMNKLNLNLIDISPMRMFFLPLKAVTIIWSKYCSATFYGITTSISKIELASRRN